jgi:hypothetical protein
MKLLHATKGFGRPGTIAEEPAEYCNPLRYFWQKTHEKQALNCFMGLIPTKAYISLRNLQVAGKAQLKPERRAEALRNRFPRRFRDISTQKLKISAK